MSTEDHSKEQRILRMMKKVLTDIAKDTYTRPGLKHPLSDHTIHGIRECLTLITAREGEIATEQGREMNDRPHFVDEPKKTVVVPLHKIGLTKRDVDDKETSD